MADARRVSLARRPRKIPTRPGPLQPIQFSHKHHAGQFQIDCQYCHSGTDRSPAAGVPSVELCMGCHAQFPASYDELEGIRTLKEHWEEKQPIEWVQIHRAPRVRAVPAPRPRARGLRLPDLPRRRRDLRQAVAGADTMWWPWLLPAAKLEMGWCIDCHRQNNATQDCYACHY